uniref:Endothelial cell surface expressed chemotaxis and apoptosis regulator n=1 Tax=Ficedula albicollis TaxID=59894 RepID=A0A803VUU5_FICAL
MARGSHRAEMLLPSIHPLLGLLLLLPGSTAPTNSSTPAGTGQPQAAASPEAKNHSSEPSVKSTPLTNLSLTSVGPTPTTVKPSPTTTTTLTATTERDDKSSGNRSTAAPPPTPQGQDPVRNLSTTTSATPGASSSQRGTSKPITPTPNSSSRLPEPTPTDEKSPLTVAAFGKGLWHLGRGGDCFSPGHAALDTPIHFQCGGGSINSTFPQILPQILLLNPFSSPIIPLVPGCHWRSRLTFCVSLSAGQDPVRNLSTTTSATPGASSSQRGTSKPITPTPNSSSRLPEPTPTDEKSPLTVAAFGVISFVVILIVVVIILVSVVSLRFKCNHSKDSEDKQKPGSSMVSESCSADTSQKGNSITLISMKNINTNNSMSYPPSEKVL